MSARTKRWLWFALALATVALVLFPVYWMVVTSLLPSSVVLSRHPPLIPPLDKVSFAAFAEVFGRRPVLTWIWNSTLVVAGSTAAVARDLRARRLLAVAVPHAGAEGRGGRAAADEDAARQPDRHSVLRHVHDRAPDRHALGV